MLPDYYRTLELPRDATGDEIIAQSKAKLISIDKAQAENVLPLAALEAARKAIVEATDTLIDEDSRAVYDADLELAGEFTIDPTKEQYFDFDAVRQQSLTSWKDTLEYDGTCNLALYKRLLKGAANLDNEIHERIILAAFLTPSTLSNKLPILLFSGIPGSGKSRLGTMASKIWGTEQQVGATPYAAIRRIIAEASHVWEFGKKKSLNYILCWDDVTPTILKNQQLYSLIKSAYDRETAIIRISKENSSTETVAFNCFGMRVISSKHAFYADPHFDEMTRRSLVVETKKRSLESPIHFSGTNWGTLPNLIVNFWEHPDNHNPLIAYQSAIPKMAKSSLAEDRIDLCKDVLATGLVFKIWDTISDAINDLEKFYSLQDDLIKSKKDVVFNVLNNFTKRRIDDFSEMPVSVSPCISAEDLKKFVNGELSRGVITRNLRYNELAETMTNLGWEMNVDRGQWIYRR